MSTVFFHAAEEEKYFLLYWCLLVFKEKIEVRDGDRKEAAGQNICQDMSIAFLFIFREQNFMLSVSSRQVFRGDFLWPRNLLVQHKYLGLPCVFYGTGMWSMASVSRGSVLFAVAGKAIKQVSKVVNTAWKEGVELWSECQIPRMLCPFGCFIAAALDEVWEHTGKFELGIWVPEVTLLPFCEMLVDLTESLNFTSLVTSRIRKHFGICQRTGQDDSL